MEYFVCWISGLLLGLLIVGLLWLAHYRVNKEKLSKMENDIEILLEDCEFLVSTVPQDIYLRDVALALSVIKIKDDIWYIKRRLNCDD